MTIKKTVLVLILMGGLLVSSSCRLGEILSEADPETEADLEKGEKLPQMEKDYNKKDTPPKTLSDQI